MAGRPTDLAAPLNPNVGRNIYSKLGPNDIRFVTLHAGEDDSIRCSLTTESVLTSPKYEALSYVWGSQANPAAILLAGEPFLVTQNLYQALSHLRLPSRDRVLWIDAIAINQADLTERSELAADMRNIYSKAASVLVWLGAGDEKLDRFFGQLHDLYRNHSQDHTPLHTAQVFANPEWDSAALFDAIKVAASLGTPDAEGSGEWMAEYILAIQNTSAANEAVPNWQIEELLQILVDCTGWLRALPYWNRVWVLQEVMYANGAELAYGFHTIPYRWCPHCYSGLALALISLANFAGDQHGRAKMLIYLFADNIHSIFQFGPKSAKHGDLMSARDWLDSIGRKYCSEPRDIVFGFYGCMVPGLRDKITVDYNRSIAEVYSEMVEAFVQEIGHLKILLQARSYSREGTELPSWVPNFGGKVITSANSLSYAASRKLSAGPIRMLAEVSNMVLHVKSLHIAYADCVSDAFINTKTKPSTDVGDQGLQMLSMLVEHLIRSKVVLRAENMEIATIFFEILKLEVCIPKREIANLLNLYEAAMGVESADPGAVGRVLRSLQNMIRENSAKSWAERHHNHSIFRMVAKERYRAGGMEKASESNNHHSSMDLEFAAPWNSSSLYSALGTAPADVQSGDEIHLVLGCEIPLVIRRGNDGGCVLIGTALIPGRSGYRPRTILEASSDSQVWEAYLEDLYLN